MIEVPGYRLIERLGGGSGGVVYLAEQLTLNRRVALKILASGLFADEQASGRFLNEAHTLSRLGHPNVVAVYDAQFTALHPYIAMEFMSGGTLRSELERVNRFPLRLALEVGCAVARGLQHAHRAGVIHRDLKPENVLLDARGEVKIADFGLSRNRRPLVQVQTGHGIVLGTPGYIAPDVLEGGPPTAASDLFSLGVLLLELVSGANEKLERWKRGQTVRTRQEPPPGPSDLVNGLPADFDALVRECLSFTAASRPPLSGALRRMERLRERESHVRLVPEPTPPPPPRTSVRPKAPGFWTAGAATLLAVSCLVKLPAPPAPPALAPRGRASHEIRSIATGPDRARVFLTAPVDRGERIELVDESTGASTSLEVPAGASSVLASGLGEDHAYLARAGGELSPAVPFRTRPRSTAAGLLRLFPATGAAADSPETLGTRKEGRETGRFVGLAGQIAMTRRDRDIYVAAGFNRTYGSRLQFVESADEGETWSDPVELAPTQATIGRMSLGVALGGLLAAWHIDAEHAEQLWVSWRGAAGGKWSAPAASVRCHHNPGVLIASDGVLRVMALVSGKQKDGPLQYLELDGGSGREILRVRGPRVEMGSGTIVQQKIVQTTECLFWLARTKDAAGNRRVLWSRSPRPELGIWEPPQPVDGPRPGAFDLHAEGRRVLLAQEVQSGLGVWQSPDGRKLEPAVLEPRPSGNCTNPGLAAGGRGYLLAFHDEGAGLGFQSGSLRLYSSQDGLSWRGVESRRARTAACRSLDLVAGPDFACVLLYDELEGLLALRLKL